MGKRLLASFLAAAMMLTMAPVAFAIENTEDTIDADQIPATEEAVAGENQIETKDTSTLQSAIDAANGSYTLTEDTTADITINKDLVLDLGCHTLTNTNAGKATITVANGAAVTVKNGFVVGGKSFYNIQVAADGRLTLEGVTATAGNNGSAMIDNLGTLTITSGTYTGGLDTVKNEPNAALAINGGKFELQEGTSKGFTGVVFNYGNLTINDGEFLQSDTSALYGQAQVIHTDKSGSTTPSTKITGGTFTNNGTSSTAWCVRETNAAAGSTTVSGGKFNKFNKTVNSSYLPDGYASTTTKVDGYYKIGTAITSVKLEKSELTLKGGESYILEATVAPPDAAIQTITWTCSDKHNKIATVNPTNGRITAKQAGDVTITATPAGKGGTPATCEVHIVDGDASITSGRITTQYPTLAKAIEKAKDGQTVKLLNDVDLDKTIAVSGKTITLDMNGHTIYNTNDLWDKPTGEDSNWSLISVRENGNLTITGNGTLKAKENDCYAIDVQDTDAVLTVENGKVVGNIHAVYVTEGTAYIKGGTYSVQQKYPKAGLEDEFVLNLLDSARRDGTAKMIVTGGTFANFNPANCQAEGAGTNFCAPGYKTELTNGVYVVKAGTNDAMELVDTALKTKETDDVKNALEAVSQIPNSTLADNSSVMEKLGQLEENLTSGTSSTITVEKNSENASVTLSEVKNAALSASTTETAKQTITITVKDDPTAKTDVAQSAVAGATDAKGLDITMTKTVENGEPTTIDKLTAPVVLTFTLPEGWKNAQIVYVDENNQPEMVKTTVNGDKVTGVFNHFSPYILVKTAEAQNPNAYEIILTPNQTDVCAGDTLSYTISLKHTAGDGAQGMFTFVPDITSGLLTNGTFVAETDVNAEYGPDSKTNKDKLVIRDLDLATGQTLKIGTLKYTVDAYGIDGTQVRYTRNSKGVVTNQGYSKEASVSLLNEQDVTYHLAKVTFQPFTGAATEGYAVYGTNEIYATLNDLKTRNAEAKVTAPALSTATTGGTVYRVLDDQWHLSTDENQTFALSGSIKTSVTFVEKYVKLVKVTIPQNASNKDLVEITETITRKNGEDSYVDYGTNLKFKLTADAKADAGKKYVVKVKVDDGEAFAPTGPDASDIYTVEASKITGDVSFELSQEMNLTADDIGIFIDTDTTNHTTSYRNYSVYSGERTLVLIKGDKKAQYQFSDTAAQHPTIYKTGAQYEGYNFGVLIDPTGVAMTQEDMLNYLVNTLGLHIVTNAGKVNPTITYNYRTAGVNNGEALVDAQITRDFSELEAGNKWHWAPSDDLLLKADVITVGNGNKYTKNTYTGTADGHVSTDDVNTFMYLHVGMPKINP